MCVCECRGRGGILCFPALYDRLPAALRRHASCPLAWMHILPLHVAGRRAPYSRPPPPLARVSRVLLAKLRESKAAGAA